MVDKYLSNRLVILYIIPFAVGSLTVLSFQPFNSLIINFFVLPTLFYLIIFITKKSKSTYRKKPYKKIYLYLELLLDLVLFKRYSLDNIFFNF